LKKPLPLYPFLYLLCVILSPLAHNLGQLDPLQALKSLAVLWLVSALGLVVFFLLFKDWQYASYLVFLINVFFLAFGSLDRLIQDQLSIFWRSLDEQVLLAIWACILFVLGIKKIWNRLGGRTWMVSYLNLLMGFWLIIPLAGILFGLVRQPFQSRVTAVNAQSGSEELSMDCSNTPDIYYIILDGYGRADMLSNLYQLDTQPFLNTLEEKGFYVAHESFTNYTQTIYSIPAGLNFRFIESPGEGLSGQIYFSGLVRENAIMKALKRCGYQTISLESGFFFTDHPDVDLYLEESVGNTEFDSLLLVNSPLDVLADELKLEPPELSYATHRERVRYSFDQLAGLYAIKGPKFIFAHIVSPHPPFVFDQNGQPVDPTYPYYIGDGDDYQGSRAEYLAGYSAQVQFVNQQLERVIDAVLANSTQPPIIILQGDHGPGSRLVWDAPDQSCLWERTPILNAYYLPEDGASVLYPSISPVNSFRVVLNTYFGTQLPLLPDKTYFTSHRLERQVIDITAQRTLRANCALP
jgi:hypothetical protein